MTDPRMVHVIDDDAPLRDSLLFLLSSSGLNATGYDSPQAFLAATSDLTDGCIVTDVRMPGMSGVDLLRKLKGAGSTTPVIVMTGHGDVSMAVEAMKLGAFDFIEKPFSDQSLISAVEAALEIDPTPRGGAWPERLADLSPRERQVLEGLVGGKPNKEIARDLAISPRTIEIYRAKVMTKMGADSFAELIRMAIAAGVGGG
jgi:two-component system response regulator FixJ